MDALHTIMNDLKSGKTYGKTEHGRMCNYFWWELYKSGDLIYWRHFGQSANRCTLKDLEWIIRVIFRTTPEKFVTEYECIYY